MIRKATHYSLRWHVALFFIVTSPFWASCAGGLSGGAAQEVEHGNLVKENRRLKKALAESEDRCKKLEDAVKTQEAERNKLEDQMARINLLLVEKETQIKKLEERQGSSEKKLDEAIQEVVRAKAKLRSLESRAEAASNIAETEIAIKVLKTQQPESEKDPELIQAEQLLKMSAKEFKKENYGGALYLTNQAKGRIRIAQTRLVDKQSVEAVQGEVLFALPLPLQVIKPSNIREGPGLEFEVVTTVETDTPLVGYSYKGKWVRVKGENGVTGWIFQALVTGR